MQLNVGGAAVRDGDRFSVQARTCRDANNSQSTTARSFGSFLTSVTGVDRLLMTRSWSGKGEHYEKVSKSADTLGARFPTGAGTILRDPSYANRAASADGDVLPQNSGNFREALTRRHVQRLGEVRRSRDLAAILDADHSIPLHRKSARNF